MVRSPFSDIDHTVLRHVAQEIAEQHAAQFHEFFEAVKAIYRKAYPLHIVSVVAQYGLVGYVSANGVSERSPSNQIDQHHCELLFAITQMTDRSEWGNEPANPQVVQEAMDAIVALASAFQSLRFAQLDDSLREGEKAAIMLQENLRLHTQIVRNWGYFSQVVEMSRELYLPLDGKFKGKLGFSASEAIDVLAAVVKRHEDKTNHKFQRLQRVLREKNRSRIAQKFKQLFPEFTGDFDAWLAAIPRDAPKESVSIGIIDITDRLCVEINCVDAEEIAGLTALSAELVIKVLSAFSRPVDSLLDQKPEFVFLDNPIWDAPFLNEGGTFFSPIPQIAFSHIHRLIKRLSHESGTEIQLSKARAKFLEGKVEGLVKKALPSAQVTPNLKWKIGEQQFETDVLAVIDKVVLIVEAKSAALSEEGLRGALKRTKRHVKELIQEPAQQSMRLEQAILEAQNGDKEAQALLKVLGIDADRAEVIIRLSVTLDDFSMLANLELELKEAGWIKRDLPLPPTINVADLDCIVDLLEEPVFFLHYLIERDRIQKTHISGYEMDFLGLYLDTGFNVSAIADDNISLMLTGMSNKIDHYYNSRDAGVPVPKPTPVIHKQLLAMVRACQDRQAVGWTKLGPALLELGNIKEQKGIFNALARLKKKVRRTYRDPKHECAMIVTPPYREFTYLFHVYPEALRKSRNEIINELAGRIMAEQGRNKCVIVSQMLEERDHPCHLIAMALAEN